MSVGKDMGGVLVKEVGEAAVAAIEKKTNDIYTLEASLL